MERMFNRIRIKGFRRLHDVDFELRPLTVLIGANGVGKTTMLDVFALLAESAKGHFSEKIGSFGGVSSIATYDRASGFSIGLDMKQPEAASLNYNFIVSERGNSYVIEEETLTQNYKDKESDVTRVFAPEERRWLGKEVRQYIDSKLDNIAYTKEGDGPPVRPTWEHDPRETSLSQAPKEYRITDDFRKRLASLSSYHLLDVDPRAPVRLPQQIRPITLPGENGEDLISCLFSLFGEHLDRFAAILDTLKAAFPDFEQIGFRSVAAGTLVLTWKYKEFSQPMYMNQLSEGILRFLWLTTLLHSPELPAVTVIDEPEVSLHPELLSLLAGIMREASERTQLIVATHSDRLVSFLEPREVAVMDMAEDGSSTLAWADGMDLEKWLDEYTLGDVWRMGQMGGQA